MSLWAAMSWPTQARAETLVHHPKSGYTFYVVPHSHMDLEWMWTFEQGQAFAIRILHQALQMLKDDPRFTFTQDQVAALRPFWESLSRDDQNFLRLMVREGRFEVATGMWIQPDVNEPDFESLTRQFLLAKPWLEETLGAQVLTGWNIDTFGQTVQMPQLFSQAGLHYAFFSRDFPTDARGSDKNLFYWRAPDGSQVLAHIDRYTFGAALTPQYLQAFGLKMLKELMDRNPLGNDKIMIPWGYDEYLPTETSRQIDQMLRRAASKLKIPVKTVIMSTPSRYFADVEKTAIGLPTYTYDFNPPLNWQDLRGTWGQRPRQKVAERKSEDMLASSEKIASVMNLYGVTYPVHALAMAWQGILTNQLHDTIAGANSDDVYEASLSRYAGAIEIAREAQAGALFQLSRKIDTSRSGDFPIVVFNALSFPRTETVRFRRTFWQENNMTHREVTNFRILDAENRSVPFRVLRSSRYKAFTDGETGVVTGEEGPLTMADVEFIATEMPALGYRVYRLEPVEGDLQPSGWQPVEGEITTPYFNLSIDAATGSISKLIDRRSGSAVLRISRYAGNELVLVQEKNPDMEGMIHFTGKEFRGSQFQPASSMMRRDELGTTIKMQGPFLSGERIQQIRLYNKLPRIDFQTELKGFPGQDGILTVVFPMHSRSSTKALYETHNAVVERPDGIYNAQTWVDVADTNGGTAILNQGAAGHEIEGRDVRLILFRSVTNYRAYQASKASEEGDHVFEYSLYPYSGDWSASGVVEQAHSYNSPLRVISTDAHGGSWPLERSFLSVPSNNFEVTALKKAERGEDLVLRGHETRGTAGRVHVHIDLPVKQAWFADLLEQKEKEVDLHEGSIEFDCRPFEFVTIRLRTSP